MPILNDEELNAAIASGDIGAITLDTCIIDGFGRDFHHPMLRNLSQFAGTDTQVLFSDIVAREVQSHIERDAAQSLVEIKKALIQHRKVWHIEETIEELGSSAKLKGDPKAFACAEWEAFLVKIKGQQLEAADTLPARALLDSYFNAKPPFETEGKKKAEFPDAIALLSLEEWSRCRNTKVLAIGTDSGW